MKIIKFLSEEIEKELQIAECYAKKAIEQKSEFPNTSVILYNLSIGSLERVSKLHGQAVRIIKNYRQQVGEPPAAMMAIYEYLHDKQIEKTMGIKNLQEMFKE